MVNKMINIIKKVLSILNILLLVIAFFFILYINVYNCFYLGKNPFDDFFNFFSMLLPFICLMSLYYINFVNDHKIVNKNIFYKIVTFIVLILVIFIECRSIYDSNMVLHNLNDYQINFDYFMNQLIIIKFILYGLFFVNIIFIIEGYLNNKKKELIVNN